MGPAPVEIAPGFADRSEAGAYLARRLTKYAGGSAVVLGLPRGGVPVAYEVAHELRAPLDVFIVRKLGVPGHEELAMGAIASGGVRVLNEEVLEAVPNAVGVLEEVTRQEQRELERREREYRGGRPPVACEGKMVIIVDDGLATGATMRAAVEAIRKMRVARIVVAVPVGAADTCEALARRVDEVVCPLAPAYFRAVGQFYRDFAQTTDAEVGAFLRKAAQERAMEETP